MVYKKKSYGIICCRLGTKGTELLLVKKTVSYCYAEFVAGRYTSNNEAHIKKLFSNMTYDERVTILSMKFPTIWYKIYMEIFDNNYYNGKHTWIQTYLKKKDKFEKTFMRDSGAKLMRLMMNSGKNVETAWEFPKGRKNEGVEDNITAAMREFEEETGVKRHMYRILWNIKPYIITHTDFGKVYQNVYFYAEAIGDWEPIYNFADKHQIREVSDIRWMTKNDLKYINLERTTYKRMIKCFNKIIKKYKNARGSNILTLDKIINERLKPPIKH